MHRAVEETGNHGDAAVLDVGGLRVFLVVDKILREGICHELLNFILHVRGNKASQVQSRNPVKSKIVPTASLVNRVSSLPQNPSS